MKKNTVDICFYEAFGEEVGAIRKYLDPAVRAVFLKETVQESGHGEPPAPLVSIRTQSVLPVSWADRMSGVLARTTGYDHILQYRRLCGKAVPAGVLPPYSSRAVAEQAMLMWTALMRKLMAQVEKFRRFERDGLTGAECEKKVLLVAGVGNIGHEVCRIGTGLGMEVIGVDIVERHGDVTYVQPDEGIRRADVIVAAMNLTEDNRGYFDYRFLKKARPGAVFVNVARGELSPTEDLARLLDEGRLGGVGLDVYDREQDLAVALRTSGAEVSDQVQAVLALSERENVILTPHNAFNTVESLERKAQFTAEQAEHFIRNGAFLWPVP